MNLAGTIDSTTGLAPSSKGQLRRWNAAVGAVHLVQAIVILAMSNSFTLPVSIAFVNGQPGTAPSPPDVVWNARIGPAVALFLLFAAVDHLLMALPRINDWYLKGLRSGINRARWSEYSISASIMMVLIAMVTGILNLPALVAIFGANMAMILFGLLMEAENPPDRSRTTWWPFIFGSLAGLVPWIAVAMQLVYTEQHSSNGIPAFVYGIIVSLFICFNSFAVNMVLHYRRIGPWRSDVFTERAYIMLSLVAKSLLAWQIFANTLV